MTDNPWDELNESNDKQSSVDNKSAEDFFSFKKNNKDNNKDNSSKKDNPDKKTSNVFFTDINFSIPFGFKKNLNLFFCFSFVILLLWLISGIYTVRQEESAIVMRFGKYVRDIGPGLHYHFPYPIEEVTKEATTRVRVLKIGGDVVSSNNLGEGWALTGDENIVNLELNVQWKIDNLKKFIFNVRDKEQTIYDATQSAVREVISKRKLASILTSERGEIEEETKKLLQEMLNSYDMGINILVIQMLKIDPPTQVLDSFRDVQTARVDKESEINMAYKYKNDILPKVRGEAGGIIEKANGYAISIVNKAKGDANRFNQIYDQYKNAPFVTRKNMYLEAMGELFTKNKITVVDENVKSILLDNKNKNDDKQAEKNILALEENEEKINNN